MTQAALHATFPLILVLSTQEVRNCAPIQSSFLPKRRSIARQHFLHQPNTPVTPLNCVPPTCHGIIPYVNWEDLSGTRLDCARATAGLVVEQLKPIRNIKQPVNVLEVSLYRKNHPYSKQTYNMLGNIYCLGHLSQQLQYHPPLLLYTVIGCSTSLQPQHLYSMPVFHSITY